MDAVLAIRKQGEPIDLHMVEIMEMMHKSDTDTKYVCLLRTWCVSWPCGLLEVCSDSIQCPFPLHLVSVSCNENVCVFFYYLYVVVANIFLLSNILLNFMAQCY